MKITFIARYFPDDMKGGGEFHIYELWKRTKQDYNVSLISGWKNNPNLLPENTYPIKMTKNKWVNYIKFYFKTKKYLKQIKPDIIFSSCPEIPLPTKSVVLVPHFGHWLHLKKLNPLEKLQRYFYVNKMKKYNRILVSSKATKKDLEQMGLIVHNISYPGPNKDYKPLKHKNKFFTITYASRFSKEKGQHIAIESIKLLPRNIQNKIKLILVGFLNDQEYFSELKKQAKDLPVEFHTNVESTIPFFQKTDIMIFPTLMYEGFGMVAAEALACEKPVIASDYPAIREAVDKFGLYFEPGNAKQLSEHIQNLYQNNKLRTQLGKQGRKYVLENFSWKKRYKELKEIFESLK